MYREQLLERSLQTLLAPGGKLENDEDPMKRTQTEDVLTYVKLLMDNCLSSDNNCKHINAQCECFALSSSRNVKTFCFDSVFSEEVHLLQHFLLIYYCKSAGEQFAMGLFKKQKGEKLD